MDIGNYANTKASRRTAWYMALAGFIPFALFAGLLYRLGHTSSNFASFLDLFKLWSIVVLTFLAGIRWGFALIAPPFDRRTMVLAGLVPLFAMLVMVMPDVYSIMLLLVLHCAHGAWDNFHINKGHVPPWLSSIRVTFTLAVAVAHICVVILASGGISLHG